MKAAELFDRGFSSRSFFGPTLDALPASVLQTPPNMRPVICDRRGPMPEEDDTAPTVSADSSSGPNLFSSNVLAFAGGSTDTFQRTTLGPRAAVQPVRVWIGLNPPSESDLATQAAEEEAAEQARKAKGKKSAVKRAAADPDVAIPAGAIEEGKGKNGRSSLSLKPVNGADVTRDAPAKAKPVNGADVTRDAPAKAKPVNGADVTRDAPAKAKPVNGADATRDAPAKAKPVNGADVTRDAPAKAKPVNGDRATNDAKDAPAAKMVPTPIKAKPEARPPAKPDVKADAAQKPATKTN
jgi:D-alanyl-D-alanine carboxypeptidase